MKRNYLAYTDEDIIDRAKYVTSLSQLLKELGLRPAGGNFNNMKRNIARLNIDISHWTGQAWNLDLRLKEFADYKSSTHLKKHVEGENGNKCAKCGINEWRSRPLVMELNHINGDRRNNELFNLELLCPNCHSQTPTWRNRKTDIFTNDS